MKNDKIEQPREKKEQELTLETLEQVSGGFDFPRVEDNDYNGDIQGRI